MLLQGSQLHGRIGASELRPIEHVVAQKSQRMPFLALVFELQPCRQIKDKLTQNCVFVADASKTLRVMKWNDQTFFSSLQPGDIVLFDQLRIDSFKEEYSAKIESNSKLYLLLRPIKGKYTIPPSLSQFSARLEPLIDFTRKNFSQLLQSNNSSPVNLSLSNLGNNVVNQNVYGKLISVTSGTMPTTKSKRKRLNTYGVLMDGTKAVYLDIDPWWVDKIQQFKDKVIRLQNVNSRYAPVESTDLDCILTLNQSVRVSIADDGTTRRIHQQIRDRELCTSQLRYVASVAALKHVASGDEYLSLKAHVVGLKFGTCARKFELTRHNAHTTVYRACCRCLGEASRDADGFFSCPNGCGRPCTSAANDVIPSLDDLHTHQQHLFGDAFEALLAPELRAECEAMHQMYVDDDVKGFCFAFKPFYIYLSDSFADNPPPIEVVVQPKQAGEVLLNFPPYSLHAPPTARHNLVHCMQVGALENVLRDLTSSSNSAFTFLLSFNARNRSNQGLPVYNKPVFQLVKMDL